MTRGNTFTISLLLLILAAIMFPIGSAHAAQGALSSQNAGPGEPAPSTTGLTGLQAELIIENSEYFVGDVIPLTLQVNHPAGYRLVPLQIEDAWGDVEVRDIPTPVVTANPNGSETTTQIINVALWAPGEYSTPDLPVSVVDTSGEVMQLTAPPLSLKIGSVLIEGDTNLRDIKPQAQLPLPPIWPWVVAGLFVVILFVLAAIWMIRRRRNRLAAQATAPDLRKPHEVAFDELQRIEKLNLPEQGRYKEHYTLASDVVRQYLERAYHVPTSERTTGEIRRSLKFTPLSTDIKSGLIRMLNDADLIKFAKVQPELPLAKAYIPQVRNTVAETIPPEPISENGNGHKQERINPNGEKSPDMKVTV